MNQTKCAHFFLNLFIAISNNYYYFPDWGKHPCIVLYAGVSLNLKVSVVVFVRSFYHLLSFGMIRCHVLSCNHLFNVTLRLHRTLFQMINHKVHSQKVVFMANDHESISLYTFRLNTWCNDEQSAEITIQWNALELDSSKVKSRNTDTIRSALQAHF